MKTGKVVRTLSLLLVMLMLAGMIPAALATEISGNEIQEAAAGEQPVAGSGSGEVEETPESEDGSVIVYRAFDVSLQKDGQEVAAEGEFRVTVETGLDAGSLIPEDTECVGTGCRLYHVHEGKADIVKDAEMDDDGFLTFTTPNFSTFLLEYKVNYKTITRDFITASGETYTITVTYEDNALIPDDAELNVREILPETEEFERYLADAATALETEDGNISFACFFDIEIVKDGEKIEPEVPVQVKIAYKDAVEIADGETLSVVHFAEVGEKSGPEVITDITLNDSKTELTYQQSSFSVTGTIVTKPEAGEEHHEHKYALIILYEGNYYVVENDCTLTLLEDDDITLNPDGTVNSVEMVNPVFWTYSDIGYNHGNLFHDTAASAFDPETGLPSAYIHRYINVDTEAGYVDLPAEDTNAWGRAIQYKDEGHDSNNHLYHYDYNNHTFDNYLGVKQDADGTLRICGLCDSAHAAEIYFAEASAVNEVDIRNHTVNHIDIAVEGRAGIKVPLAFGTYPLAELDDNGELTGNYRDQPLYVSSTNYVTAEAVETVDITENDLRTAHISTYTNRENEGRIDIDNVYIVTGYTQNAEAVNDIPQVRLEGSFKVADMDPVPAGVDENDPTICAQRLQNRIYYEVSLTKPVTFHLTYTDEATGKKYAVIKDGVPFEVTIDVAMSASFDFWDPANTCPGCVAIYPRERWLTGVIPENSWWSDPHHLDGGPGMDFRLGAPLQDTRHDIVAIEVIKYVQGDFGTEVRTLSLEEATECLINVYQNETMLHDKTIPVNTDGIGLIYDYDVKAGTYANPAYAQISEVADSVADEVTDAEGKKWEYHHSRVETEYVWRDNNHPSMHISDDYDKTTAGGEFYSESEILGEYRWSGYPDTYWYNGVEHDGNEFNRFLEFYIYNIYEPKKYPVFIKKLDANSNNDTGLAGAEFDLYGPYTEDEISAAGFNAKQQEKKVNKDVPIETTTVIKKIGDLSDGTYYLYETKAPNGYVLLTDPIIITVDSTKEEDGQAVSYKLNEISEAQYITGTEEDGELIFIISIPNTPGIVLPETGGKGTTVFCLLGGGLILAAGLLLARRKKYIA